ncbi:hypothetical protein D9615_003590 [Tricholomella constricta]|uniref:Uncharacterized protein n=1 Tax=Tricholomella constricta TaxID=117010 RepID=A0A8H5HHL9_9AGAR|nr:hypothetical protein D9615_003590 [Tricholomella constricta]
MHPYGPGAHYWHWHRGPRRLIWFIIGAAAATWWIKHKEERQGWKSHCIRAPIQPPVLSSNADADPWSTRGVTKAINNLPPAEMSRHTNDWNDEKQHMAEISQSAGDKLAELSEATLDTVLMTVEVLKAKLAEHRAARDKQLEEERQKKNPPRLV